MKRDAALALIYLARRLGADKSAMPSEKVEAICGGIADSFMVLIFNEREACAQIAVEMANTGGTPCMSVASKIRARGEKR